jgi:DNA-3-methyladenine glycosylase II
VEHDGRRFHGTPDSRAIAAARPAALCACGLSARKAEALRAIARAIASGALAVDPIEDLPTEHALRLLLTLPGIGPWSAALVLLRGFRRLDVFPPGDVGAQRSVAALLKAGRDELAERVERFGELRGYLYFVGLGGTLLRNGLIEPASEAPSRAVGRRNSRTSR